MFCGHLADLFTNNGFIVDPWNVVGAISDIL